MTARYNYLYKWVDERIEIDYDKAKAWLWECFQRDIKERKKNTLMNYNARLANVMQIKEGIHRFRIDRTSGRLHTLICSLKKELRQFVTYDGQQLVAIDIRCSQPTLSTVLLNPDFYLDLPDNKGMLNIHRVFPTFCKELSIQPIQEYVVKNREKFASYIEAVDNDLYLYMLTAEELKAITDYPLTNDSLEKVRSLFLFAVYTGLWYKDCANLTADKLTVDANGRYWIETVQEKTNRQVLIPVLLPAREIIESYKPHRDKTGKVLPMISNQKINAYIKVIADFAGVNKVISHHVARHTFCTTILSENQIDIASISTLAGHSSLASTMIYSKTTRKALSDVANRVEEALIKYNRNP
jgi:integrase